jgi:hypothetical protein
MKEKIIQYAKHLYNFIKQIIVLCLYILQYTMIGIEYLARQSNKILDKIILILQKNELNSGEGEQVGVNNHGFPFYFGKK